VQIIIYVVKTEIAKDLTYLTYEEKKNLEDLETIKKEIIHEYSGLTVLPNCFGYWLDQNGKLETDKVDLWIILKKTGDIENEFAIIEDFAKKIKLLTKQKSQLFQINENPYFV
jgi:hypothetical protein